MIKINLIGEKKDYSLLYVAEGVVLAVVFFLTLVGCIVFQHFQESRLAELRDEESFLKGELAKLEKQTKKVDELEVKRKTLKEKLSTIATLKLKKHGPVHILDDINVAIPARAWLTSLKEKQGTIEVIGIALDNQTVSSFVDSLNKSTSGLFKEVNIISSTEYVKDNVSLKQFTLAILLKNPLDTGKSKDDSNTVDRTKKGV